MSLFFFYKLQNKYYPKIIDYKIATKKQDYNKFSNKWSESIHENTFKL